MLNEPEGVQRARARQDLQRVTVIYDERFCRMWEFYLAGCEAAFRHSGLVNFQIQLSKRVNNVPLTRNYIFEWERSRVEDVSTTDLAIPVRHSLVNSGDYAK